MKPEKLEQPLGHVFARPELLLQALTHRSWGSPHNERIEFLGDSVLNCTVAFLLFTAFPQLREGELSRLRASLVKQETLAKIATSLKLGDYLRQGELKSGGFRRPSILADALEAIFGAIYLDAGFDAAAASVGLLYQPLIAAVDPTESAKDPKTSLQEWLQAQHFGLPRYTLAATRGEAHAQEFEVECTIPELAVVTRGSGVSRRAAEQGAAEAALALALQKKSK